MGSILKYGCGGAVMLLVIGCGFRPIPDTDSGPIIPLIPAQSGH